MSEAGDVDLCEVCHQPASELEGELTGVFGVVANHPGPEPRVLLVHPGCAEHVDTRTD